MGLKKQSHQQPSMPTLDFLTRQQQTLSKIKIIEEPKKGDNKTRNQLGARHNSVVMTRTAKNMNISSTIGDKTLTERKFNLLDESTKVLEESKDGYDPDYTKLTSTITHI